MNWNATYEITVSIRNTIHPYRLWCWNSGVAIQKGYPATRDKSPQAFQSMYVYYHQGNPGIINLIKTYPGRRIL